MKKSIILLSCILFSGMLVAQDLKNYIQFSAGYAPATHSYPPDMYVMMIEYGKTYKWLDLGVSLDRENGFTQPFKSDYYSGFTYYKPDEHHFPDGHYLQHSREVFTGMIATAIRLNAKINIVRLFTSDSRHAFKVGGGWGYVFEGYFWSNRDSDRIVTSQYHIVRSWSGTVKATYEFALTPKILLGAFYFMGKSDAFGLSIRRNF